MFNRIRCDTLHSIDNVVLAITHKKIKTIRSIYHVESMLWVALFAALTAAGGAVRIPTPPIPITLQTLFVYLAGSLLGSTRGAASQIIFLMIGLMGIPVFGSGGGPGYVLQPTFGYLIGFPVAAWVIGKSTPRNKSGTWLKIIMANGLGCVVIHTTGVIYLYFCMQYILKTPISWSQALMTGVLIFLPGELIKIALSASLTRRMTPLLKTLSKDL